jgi:tryptophan synthase beta chain
VVQAAAAADAEGRERTILFNLSGHGHFDMGAYDEYFAGNLPDFEYDESLVEAALSKLPTVGAPA